MPLSLPHRLVAGSLSAALLLATTACSTATPDAQPEPARTVNPVLRFDPSRYQTQQVSVNGQTLAVRAYEGLAYVAQPVDPAYQVLNLYIPEAYFHGQRVGAYSAETAPIFLPNQVGGYMPAKPGTLAGRSGPPPGMPASAGAPPAGGAGAGGPPGGNGPSAIAVALSRGLVVASPGARGRTLKAADGQFTGKAPAAIVDLKAAVRWLRFNDADLPGDANRIVSNGTSAGGALSALLGASGNSPDYTAELQALGAAPGRDDIFAVSAYCPITNLEQADAAYEWQFNGVNDYRKVSITMLDYNVQRQEVAGSLTPAQQALSGPLKASFPAYVNSLQLRDAAGQPLTLDARGEGPFKAQVKRLVMASAQRALDQGADLSGRPWLTLDGKQVRDLDFNAYVRAMGRMKTPPAFDGVALESGENELFGTATTAARHFTPFALQHSTVTGASLAPAHTVKMMNAMRYLGDAGATPAAHWRIRHGTQDRDTSLAVPVMLATRLQNLGHDVDLALPWDRPHSGDYDLDELFSWVDQVVRSGR